MVPVSCVTCQVPVALAEWYCTDQPSRLTAAVPRLRSSMKSVVYVAPELPPPPLTSLTTMPEDGAAVPDDAPPNEIVAARARPATTRATRPFVGGASRPARIAILPRSC